MYVKKPRVLYNHNNGYSQIRVGDTVTVGIRGVVGKVIDIAKPLGMYEMFKIQSYHDGSIHSAAHYELVKGLRDDEFDFFEISDDDFRQLLDIDTISVSTNVVETEMLHTVTSKNPTRTSEIAPPQTAVTSAVGATNTYRLNQGSKFTL